jgi:hypothetical protein
LRRAVWFYRRDERAVMRELVAGKTKDKGAATRELGACARLASAACFARIALFFRVILRLSLDLVISSE